MNKMFFGVLAALVLALAGCASAPVKREPAVFFPTAPELPRLQFLTSYTGLKDVEEQSGFNRFVTGEKQNLELDKPYGIGIYDGKLYVCDTNSTVIILDFPKKQYHPLEAALSGPGKLNQPQNISIEEDGTKYITDPVRAQVVVFDRNDQYVKAFGSGDWRPVDAVPYGDRLYVADMASGQVKVFDKASGQIVKTIGDKGDPAERLDRPTNLAFDPQGYLYVTDVSRFQIVKFDRDGHYKGVIGAIGDSAGHFARPKGIAIDRDGYIYVVDSSFNNIQVFNKDGRFLMFFGEPGIGPGQFTLPAKVAIDYKNVQYFQKFIDPNFQVSYLVLVTDQFEKRKVNVLAYGKQKGKKYPTDEELMRSIEDKKKKQLETQTPSKP